MAGAGCWAYLMQPVILTRDEVRRGVTRHDLARLERRGELVRIRRGAYVNSGGTPALSVDVESSAADLLADKHRELLHGTLGQLHPRAVVSHGSAAVLHGLPIFPDAVRVVHVTRDRRGGGVQRSSVQVHGSVLRPADITTIDQIPVTSMARTVSDLARSLPFEQAVAIGDRALALGLDAADLAEAIEMAARWAGAAQARRVADFIDGRSESVGESFSRVAFDRDALPAPIPQFEVLDDEGLFVARADFGWPEMRTLGEFDGREKYLRLRRQGETLEEFLLREKVREDALRDLGWEVVRWMWPDLFRRHLIADRLQRAFERGRLRPAV